MQTWIIYALMSAVFASLVAIFGKLGMSHIDSALATSLRAIVMALFLFIVSLSLGKFGQINTVDKRAIIFIVLSGVVGALSWLAYFLALKYGPPSGVAALDRLSVVFVLIFSVLFLSQKLTIQSGIGALLITIGAILMTL